MENKDKTGAFFTNAHRKNPKAPNFTGYAYIGNVRYRMAIWEKISKEGETYYSVSFDTEDKSMPQKEEKKEEAIQDSSYLDDEIIF